MAKFGITWLQKRYENINHSLHRLVWSFIFNHPVYNETMLPVFLLKADFHTFEKSARRKKYLKNFKKLCGSLWLLFRTVAPLPSQIYYFISLTEFLQYSSNFVYLFYNTLLSFLYGSFEEILDFLSFINKNSLVTGWHSLFNHRSTPFCLRF